MAFQRAKPSLIGDLLLHTMNIDAENTHEHQNHGLLSPSTSISRSHEGGEDVIDPLGKPSMLHLSSPELGDNTTIDYQPQLTSHSLPYEHGQELKESIKPDITAPIASQTIPSTNVQVDVSEASKQQSTEVAQQPSSFPTPIPSSPFKAQHSSIELTSPPKPNTQPIPPPFKRKARRMAPQKVPTPPIPLKIRILALADRHAHPYASIEPRYTFTLKAIPDTTIREACVHAGIYLNDHITTSVDSKRFEARDGNGYVFDGTEMIGQEIGAGGDLYLIENALEPKNERRSMLRNLDASETSVRTPKAAKKVKEPRKTPSQRNKEIAEAGRRLVKSEPRKTSAPASAKAGRAPRSVSRRRSLSLAPLELEDDEPSADQLGAMSPEPQQGQGAPESVLESIEGLSQAVIASEKQSQVTKKSAAPSSGIEATEPSMAPARSAKRGVAVTKPTKPDDMSKDLVQSIEQVPSIIEKQTNRKSPSRPPSASQHELLPHKPTAKPPSQDLSVVPDSQDQASQSVEAPYRDETMTTSWTPINVRRRHPEKQQHSATQPKAKPQHPLADAQDSAKPKQPQFLLGRPDPYDISAVLSDDEYYSPRPSKTIMSSTVRKLGSATKCSTPASAPIPRNTLLIAKDPPAAQEQPKLVPVRAASAGPSQERVAVPSTPLAHAAHNTPAQTTAPSSAPGTLLSSPTNHVAAALARGRAKARRQPQPECSVIEDSDVEVPGDVLKDSQDPTSKSYKSKSLETSLPWSAPPLRIDGEDPFWTLRTTGRRPSVRRKSDVDEELDLEIVEIKPKDRKEHAAVPVPSSEVLDPLKLSTSNISSFDLGSPVKDPAKRVAQEATPKSLAKSALKTPSQASPNKSPLLLVHGSSSSEEGVEEIGYVDKTLAKDKPESPRKDGKKAATQNPSNQDEAEDEDDSLDFMAGHVLAKTLSGDEEPIEPRHIAQEDDGLDLPDDNATRLSETNELRGNVPATLEDHPQLPEEPLQLSHSPKMDPKPSEVIHDTPPSGQPSKRKRDFDDNVDSEEERRIAKTVRREAKNAKRKRLREEKLAREEQQRRNHKILLEEERKREAMEKAYRRARELELVVSSPSKAAEMGLEFSDPDDSDQESELGSSPPECRAIVPPVFEVSDDSLESKGSEESQSWRKLSKRHFTVSPSSNLKNDITEGPKSTPTPAPSTSGGVTAAGHASVVLADHKAQAPQEIKDSTGSQKRAQRKSFEDWAFLETIMGTSAYSPLQVHNRIHMQMVLANLQGQTSRGAQEAEDLNLPKKIGDGPSREMTVEVRPDTAAERQDDMRYSQFEKKAQAQESAKEEDNDEDAISQHTVRSPAPSPKDLTVGRAQALKGIDGKEQSKKAKIRVPVHRNKNNTRKKKWRRKEKPSHCKELKRKHAFGTKGREQ